MGGGRSRMHEGRVAMGKKVQREERRRHANRWSNRENERKYSKKAQVMVTSHKMFLPFVWPLTVRWECIISTTTQLVLKRFTLTSVCAPDCWYWQEFCYALKAECHHHHLFFLCFLFLCCWCFQVCCSDIDLHVVKQINLSGRICITEENKQWSRHEGTNEAHLLALFAQQPAWDWPFKDFLSLVLPSMEDLALGTLRMYLCPRRRIPEQEENMPFL